MNEPDLQTSQAEGKAQERAASDWPSPGQKMRKLREELGLSHGRVADALHLTAHYVKALESDQFDKLPGKTFVKGYFRSYAKLLGADVEEVMTCYQQFVDALEESSETEANVIRAKKAHDQNLRWMLCAAAIIVAVVGVSWWLAQRGDGDASMAVPGNSVVSGSADTTAEAPVTAAVRMASLEDAAAEQAGAENMAAAAEAAGAIPEMTGTPEAAAAVSADHGGAQAQDISQDQEDVTLAGAVAVTTPGDGAQAETVEPESVLPDYTVTELNDSRMVQLESDGEDLLEVHFTGASWIEVDNGDNTRLYNDMLESGDDLTIRGKAPFNVLIGDANVVDITFNSREVDVTTRMRTDNSARIILEPETR